VAEITTAIKPHKHFQRHTRTAFTVRTSLDNSQTFLNFEPTTTNKIKFKAHTGTQGFTGHFSTSKNKGTEWKCN